MDPTNNEHLNKTPSTGSAKSVDRRDSDAGSSETNKGRMQGEGNYEAAREFNEAERKFVAAGKVDAAALAAAPKSEQERQQMIAAEQEGRRRAKKEAPAPTKARPDSAQPKVPGKDADRKKG